MSLATKCLFFIVKNVKTSNKNSTFSAKNVILFIYKKESEVCQMRKTKKNENQKIAYKFLAYPNKKQQEMFGKTFGCCRRY